jgi:hypothetical protein
LGVSFTIHPKAAIFRIELKSSRVFQQRNTGVFQAVAEITEQTFAALKEKFHQNQITQQGQNLLGEYSVNPSRLILSNKTGSELIGSLPVNFQQSATRNVF